MTDDNRMPRTLALALACWLAAASSDAGGRQPADPAGPNPALMTLALPEGTPSSRGAALREGTAAGGRQPARRAPAADSDRLARAKDLMSTEQWVDAIPLLRAAAADPKEPARDEALFWLAHSQSEAGQLAEAVDSIRRLQSGFPRSRWVRPAQSLLIELAQKLGRQDVLWWTAAPSPGAPSAPAPPAAPAAPPAPSSTPAPAAVPAPPRTARPAPAPRPAEAVGVAAPAPPPAPASFWSITPPDPDLRVQALGSLIASDARKAIPLLAAIALEHENPGAARRAVFVLAQSRHPEAQDIVLEVARRGAEGARIAAVRELGRFGGPEVTRDLIEVYKDGNLPVKRQVLTALGDRQDAPALLRIVRSETDQQLQRTAIVALGRAGAREPLRELYGRVQRETRRAVIAGLFSARDEEGLIRIATREKDPGLRADVLERLRLLGTPGAKAFLARQPQ